TGSVRRTAATCRASMSRSRRPDCISGPRARRSDPRSRHICRADLRTRLGGDGGAASGRRSPVAADGDGAVRGMFDGPRVRAVLVVGAPDEPSDARIGLASVLVVGEGKIEVAVEVVRARGAVLNDLVGGRRAVEACRFGVSTGDGVDVD